MALRCSGEDWLAAVRHLHEEPFDIEYAISFTPGENSDATEGKADTKPWQQRDFAKGFDDIGLYVCNNGIVEGEEKGAGEKTETTTMNHFEAKKISQDCITSRWTNVLFRD